MLQDTTLTSALILRVLLEGAAAGLVWVAIAHVVRPYSRQILFGLLLVAAGIYVVFALRARAGAAWVMTELIGVALYGAIGGKGLRGSLWWLAAAWALHPVWDLGLHYFGPGRWVAPPLRYPIPCLGFDLIVAAYLAYRASIEPSATIDRALRATVRS
jgi:hypothetical protein